MSSATVHTVSSASPIVRQMWAGGPLRRWSQKKTPLTPMGYSSGFVGAYVCGECLAPCEGVYELREPYKWVCAACKPKLERVKGGRR